MKKSISLLLFTCFLIFGSFFVCNKEAVGTGEIVQVGGVMVNTGSGWYCLGESSGHYALNITSVVTNSTYIRVNHDVNASQIITFIVTPDETMAQQGYRVGVSGGIDYSYIFIYDSSGNLVPPANYVNAAGNIWMYALLRQ